MSASPRHAGPLRRRSAALTSAAVALLGAAALLLVLRGNPKPVELPARPLAAARSAEIAPDLAASTPEAAPSRPASGDDAAWRAAPPASDPNALVLWIETALDPRAALGARIDAVRELAPLADEAAFAALERLLGGDAPTLLRVYTAEQLGRSPHPRAFERLATLAARADTALAMAAVRGLAHNGSPEAIDLLAQTLSDRARSRPLRDQALDSLAELPFTRTADVFREVLASPDASLEIAIEILEALGSSTPEAAGLLLEAAASSSQPELRAAALASLGDLAGADDAAGFVIPLLASETDPRVRGKLYDVLAFASPEARSGIDAGALVAALLAEEDPNARLRGARLAARLLVDRGDRTLAAAFDERMVPWLSEAAGDERGGLAARAAVDTLGSAGTPAAAEALGRLAGSSDPSLANAAARALARTERTRAGG